MLSIYNEKIRKIAFAVDAWDRTIIEATANILLALKENGFTSDDLLAYLAEVGSHGVVSAEATEQGYLVALGHKCSCGYWMEQVPINPPKGKSNVYGWKSLWYCKKCQTEEFTMEEMTNGSR